MAHDIEHKLEIYGSFEESFRGIGLKEFKRITTGYNHIEYNGFRKDVDEIFKNKSAVILPTEYGEGVPRVVLSALKNGCPSIVSKNPGCTEVIHHGETGFIRAEVLYNIIIRKCTCRCAQRIYCERNFDFDSSLLRGG